MIYIIGGAARAGKTIIARRMLIERNIPYFCVDYFVSALDQAAPELGIDAESPGGEIIETEDEVIIKGLHLGKNP